MSATIKVRLVAVALFCGTTLPAVAAPLSCPDSIDVRESLTTDAPAGWQPRPQTTPRNAASVTFFDGDPAEQASLVPDRDVKSGKDSIATWTFTPGTRPIWLSCRYLDTGISLARALPVETKRCRVRYGAGNIVKSIDCD